MFDMTRKGNLVIFILFCVGMLNSSFIFCKRQGIEGRVLLVTGNQMPSPDRPLSPGKGIKTTVYIYELTNTSQVSRVDHSAFYSSINSKLVKKVETKENGYFKVKLSPGRYSLFLQKDTLFRGGEKEDDKGGAEGGLGGGVLGVAIQHLYKYPYYPAIESLFISQYDWFISVIGRPG
jgi:hypothetical protein